MKRVIEYKIKFNFEQTIRIQKGAELLSVHCDNNFVYLFALIDYGNSAEGKQEEDRKIFAYGTGQAIVEAEDKKYISSVLTYGFCWHFFEGSAS